MNLQKILTSKMSLTLRNQDRQTRVQWAREHQCWNKAEWGTVLFTGEIRFNLSQNGELQVMKRRSERSRRRSNAGSDTDIDLGRRNVLVWAGIMKDGRTKLRFINNELTAEKYAQILRHHVLPFAGAVGPEIFTLQDDNAWPHHTRVVNEFLESECVDRMDWPPKSADLNPIETVWDELAIRAATRLNSHSSLNDLREALAEEWDALPQQLIDNLIDSMRTRVQECIDAHGGLVM